MVKMIMISKQTLQFALEALGTYCAFFRKSIVDIISSNRYKSLLKWSVEPFFCLKVCMKAFEECTVCALQSTENTEVCRYYVPSIPVVNPGSWSNVWSGHLWSCARGQQHSTPWDWRLHH